MPTRYILSFCLINFIGLIVLFYLHFSNNKDRIVFINSSTVINSYKGMIKARKEFQNKSIAWKGNIDTLSNEIQQRIMQYEKESQKMTARERQLSQELIRTKQKQLMEYQQAINTQAQQEDAKMTGEVVTEINAFIKKYGQQKGYTIVMAATDYGNIAYADEELDVTKEVIERLNLEYTGQ